jgi:hypothetical protein
MVTTVASISYVTMTTPVHDALSAAGLVPGEHAVDSRYISADLLVAAKRQGNMRARAGRLCGGLEHALSRWSTDSSRC